MEEQRNFIERVPIFASPETAAELLGLGLDVVKHYCQVKYEGFPAVKRGAHWKINTEMLSEWARKITVEEKTL